MEREFVWERYGADLGDRDISHFIEYLNDIFHFFICINQISIDGGNIVIKSCNEIQKKSEKEL